MDENISTIKSSIMNSGGNFEVVNKQRKLYRITYKDKSFFLCRKFIIKDTLVSTTEIARNKDITHLVLSKVGINTPRTINFYPGTTTFEDLKDKIKDFKFPLIIKNAEGSNSKGIYTNINSEEEVIATLKGISSKHKNIIIQEMFKGKEYRVLILDNKAIGVLEMKPPYIIGNGLDDVKNLIETMQMNTKLKTEFDKKLIKILNEQDESLESIPEVGKEVSIRRNSALDEGGKTINRTDIIHPSIEKLCSKAAKTVGLRLAGIDFMCEDITKDISQQNYTIIDINTKPDIYIHHLPSIGEPIDVTRIILDYIITKIL